MPSKSRRTIQTNDEVYAAENLTVDTLTAEDQKGPACFIQKGSFGICSGTPKKRGMRRVLFEYGGNLTVTVEVSVGFLSKEPISKSMVA